MKNIISIVMLAAVFYSNIYAQSDQFPEYSTQNYGLALNLRHDSVVMFANDAGHLLCDSTMYYYVNGLAPISTPRFITTTGGNQDCYNVQTPSALMCRLLHAYSSGSISNISALYRAQDIQHINSILSVDSVSAKFLNTVSQINKFDLVMTAMCNQYLAVFVDLYNNDTKLGTTYYYVDQTNGVWKFVSITDSTDVMPDNILMFLQYNTALQLIGINDFDNDGIANLEDNCPCTYNPNQQDMDHDGIGDECDNCPITYNPTQSDYDNDGVGDECDNCMRTYNPLQEDTDGDRIGDSCDNCPLVVNPRQLDFDGDSIGNECDPDIDGDSIPNAQDDDMDGDGVPNSEDNCPIHFNPSQSDSDNDGVGDACDCCPLVANPNQEDSDGDGVGDACESDLDHDGIANSEDNCPNTYNPDQTDKDCDGIGDVCDPDRDGDGVPNERDNCPDTFNPDQTDNNNNGIGDICE